MLTQPRAFLHGRRAEQSDGAHNGWRGHQLCSISHSVMSNFIKCIRPLKYLVERLSTAMDSIRINSVTEAVWHGRHCIVKRRLPPGRQISALANTYFELAHVPIRYWSHLGDWRRWEVTCFRMLNRDRFDAIAVGTDAVCLDKIPGESLWAHLRRGTITRGMLTEAAHELRRAHQFWSDDLGGPWSHGDASMSNFIYDQEARRVRLIDFEITHERRLPAVVRHADDLLVFLLDLAGFVSTRRWLPLALAFLRAYARPEVIAELSRRLIVPRGIARIWWNVRTNFVGAARIGWRLAVLRRAILREGPGRQMAQSFRLPAARGPARPDALRRPASQSVREDRTRPLGLAG